MVTIVILSIGPCAPVELLDDLYKQTYQDFEVLIAREKGIVNAMNIALDKAKGDIFVRIDDDVELAHDWLEALIKPFQDSQVAGVTGPTYVPADRIKNRDSIRFAYRPNWFLRWMFDNNPFAPAKIYKCGSVSYGGNFISSHTCFVAYAKDYEPDHLEGTNWAMRTHLIRQVGGFDPKFDGVAEWYDTDVEFKIKKLGYKLAYNPNAVVWHILRKGAHYGERYKGIGRIKNWLTFHWRHSEFHPKMIIWFLMFVGYAIWRRFQLLYQR